MKFFHLSDLHIGLRLMEQDLLPDQEHILKQIVERAGEEQPDAICIAGDLYNRAVPSAEAVQLFDRFVTGLRECAPEAELILIAGNHDSGERIGLYRDLLAHQHVHVAGLPPQLPDEYMQRVTVQDEHGEVDFYLLPFLHPGMVREIVGTDENGYSLSYERSLRCLIDREQIDPERRSVIVSHQFYIPSGSDPKDADRMETETVVVGNIDAIGIDVLEPFDYAALGHLHKPSCVGSETRRYCGTPMACSLGEEGQEKGIVVVEMEEKGNISSKVLPLEPLRRIRQIQGTLAEVLAQPTSDDYIQVILTEELEGEAKEALDRLRSHYPHLLRLTSSKVYEVSEENAGMAHEKLSPLEICRLFMPDLEGEQLDLLQSVIAKAQQEDPA